MTTLTESSRPAVSRFRWWIVGLLFCSTTINYVDRALFSNLVPYFEADLKLGPMDLAIINVAFLLAYGMGMTLVGRFVDRVGVWAGLAITFLVWNVASVAHAGVWSVAGFVVVRILLGIGEAGNFPAAIRTVAEWFPKRERALATGWFNCGSNIGAVVTPLLVPLVADKLGLGWRGCFLIVGGVGVVWIFFWLRLYAAPEASPHVSKEELAHIKSDPPETVGHIGVLTLLSQRQVYAYALGRLVSESPWWFYLTWMPKFLKDTYNLTPAQVGWSVAAIYLVADFGSVMGGWISSFFLKRGYTVNAARKLGLLIAALCAVPIISVAWLQGASVFGISPLWIVLPVVSLAASGHQAWSANFYTVVSDTLPKSAVATTVGIGTAFGSVGASLFQVLIAVWLVQTQNYTLPFVVAGSLYLIALLIVHLILPRLEPAHIDENTRPRVRWWQVGVVVAVMLAGLLAAQVYLNKPPYVSVADYLQKRHEQLGSESVLGPTAKVGWQEAQWVRWRAADGTTKWELIKLDRHGRPLIEAKGVGANKYVGPTADALDVQ